MEADGRELRLSNLDKVFWPEEGYTKGDLLGYYFNVAELTCRTCANARSR